MCSWIRLLGEIGLIGPTTIRHLLTGISDSHEDVRKACEQVILKWSVNDILNSSEERMNLYNNLKVSLKEILENKSIKISKEFRKLIRSLYLQIDKGYDELGNLSSLDQSEISILRKTKSMIK